VKSYALQEAVGHCRLKLQITLPQSQFCDVPCDVRHLWCHPVIK